MKKSMKRIISLFAISILTIGLLAGCKDSGKKDGSEEGKDPVETASTATMILVDQDEKEYTYELKLEGEVTVREAMIQNQLVPEEEYAAMVFETIDGHVAKMADGVLWNLCDAEGNQILSSGGFPIDEHKVKPGDTIKFVYTVAPYFDD